MRPKLKIVYFEATRSRRGHCRREKSALVLASSCRPDPASMIPESPRSRERPTKPCRQFAITLGKRSSITPKHELFCPAWGTPHAMQLLGKTTPPSSTTAPRPAHPDRGPSPPQFSSIIRLRQEHRQLDRTGPPEP